MRKNVDTDPRYYFCYFAPLLLRIRTSSGFHCIVQADIHKSKTTIIISHGTLHNLWEYFCILNVGKIIQKEKGKKNSCLFYFASLFTFYYIFVLNQQRNNTEKKGQSLRYFIIMCRRSALMFTKSKEMSRINVLQYKMLSHDNESQIFEKGDVFTLSPSRKDPLFCVCVCVSGYIERIFLIRIVIKSI